MSKVCHSASMKLQSRKAKRLLAKPLLSFDFTLLCNHSEGLIALTVGSGLWGGFSRWRFIWTLKDDWMHARCHSRREQYLRSKILWRNRVSSLSFSSSLGRKGICLLSVFSKLTSVTANSRLPEGMRGFGSFLFLTFPLICTTNSLLSLAHSVAASGYSSGWLTT